jgi:hypothetical protein
MRAYSQLPGSIWGAERSPPLAQGDAVSDHRGRPARLDIYSWLANDVPQRFLAAMLFSNACLRNKAASKMDDQVAALSFAWQNYLRMLAA